jgi:hypothetical protein
MSAREVYKKYMENDPNTNIPIDEPKLIEGKELAEKEAKDDAIKALEAADRLAFIGQLANVGSEVKNLNAPIDAQINEIKSLRDESNLSRAESKRLQEKQVQLLEDIKSINPVINVTVPRIEEKEREEKKEPEVETIIAPPRSRLPPTVIAEEMMRGPINKSWKRLSNDSETRQRERRDLFSKKVDKDPNLRINGINFEDFEQFDWWNGEGSTKDNLRKLEYVADYLVDPKEEKNIKEKFGNMFGIEPDYSIGDRAATILHHLTPRQYNDLIDRNILPSDRFTKLADPDQIGYGKNVLPALYSDQIQEFFEDDPQFSGVIAADEVKDLPTSLPMGFIMNLDPRDQPGSHWVACYINGDSVEYFDPLADPPTADFKKQIKTLLKKMNLPIMLKFKVNKIAQQHGGSYKCGYHSIRFLDDRFNNIDFPLASRFEPDKKINNSKEGEKIISEEFDLI